MVADNRVSRPSPLSVTTLRVKPMMLTALIAKGIAKGILSYVSMQVKPGLAEPRYPIPSPLGVSPVFALLAPALPSKFRGATAQ